VEGKLKKSIAIILLGGILFSFFGFPVWAETETTTLDVTVYQVVIDEHAASITGPAAGSQVELYDNLGKELLAEGTSDSGGKVSFPLDDGYPLSGKGLFHTLIRVNGVNNGEITCQKGQTCQVALFSVDGLDPDFDDAVLIVKVVSSDNRSEPVEGVQVNVWPADSSAVPLEFSPTVLYPSYEKVYYNGVPCISNAGGYCAAYIREKFLYFMDDSGMLLSNLMVKFGAQFIYDASGANVPEGGVSMVSILVNGKGKLDDCIIKNAPTDKLLNPSCMDKVHQTATAQVQVTPDVAALEVIKTAVVQANRLSADTAEIFYTYTPDSSKIEGFLDTASGLEAYDPAKQLKVILHVNEITNDEILAEIGGYAFDKVVGIYKQDDPDQLLGACTVNSLGECVTLLERSEITTGDNLMKFRVIADGYDNGIQVCLDAPFCELHAFTAVGLTDRNDAILLVKTVSEDNLLKPMQNIGLQSIRVDKNGSPSGASIIAPYNRGAKNLVVVTHGERSSIECKSNEYGFCPIYVNDIYYLWLSEEGVLDYGILGVTTAMRGYANDGLGIRIYDDSIRVIPMAFTITGSMVECVFSSPFNPIITSSVCQAKKSALLTAQAQYTATPTVTITPLPSSTPTATEIPPTPTITLTPTQTPRPGLFEGQNAHMTIGIGALLLVVLLGGGTWLLLRARKHKK
jgi:hypothetical protein